MDHSNGKHPEKAALGFEPVNYLNALYNREEAQVPLADGGVLTLRRVGLGRHFQLQALGREIREAPPEERVAALRTWLETAGIDNLGTLALSDIPAITSAAKRLNTPRGRLAWDVHTPLVGDEAEAVKATDYPGRQLARIVDLLARHYGWSLPGILELPPELALAHAQECVLADRRQREWQHYLSEIAWEYDKGSKTSRYKPMQPLPWEVAPVRRTYEPVPQWVKDKYYPKGVVIDPAEEIEKRRAAGPRE